MTGNLVWSSDPAIMVRDGVVLLGCVEPCGQMWSFCLYSHDCDHDSIDSDELYDTAGEAEAALRELLLSSPRFPEVWSPFDGDDYAFESE